jgi:predicted HicB family RNase H-like nuclease
MDFGLASLRRCFASAAGPSTIRQEAIAFGIRRGDTASRSKKPETARQKGIRYGNSWSSMRGRPPMKNNDFDGFTVNIILDEDGDWLAHLVELPGVSAFSNSPQKAIDELRIAWEGVKKSYRKHGEPIPVAPRNKNYSGQFNVRLDKRLHRALAVEAAQAGVSLNALVASKLAHTTNT